MHTETETPTTDRRAQLLDQRAEYLELAQRHLDQADEAHAAMDLDLMCEHLAHSRDAVAIAHGFAASARTLVGA